MIGTSLASLSRPLWRLLELYAIDPEFVFREAGLDPALMDDPRGRYNVERKATAVAKASELIVDPCFGLKVAEVWSPTDFHALGYAFLASSTLRTALQRFSRYVRVINNVIGLDLENCGETVSFTLRTNHPVYLPPPVADEDAMWAFITSLCRDSFGEKLNPVEVRFQHAEPSCKSDYYGLFRCPVTFGSEKSVILFARSHLDHPLPAANRELAQANDQILTDLLSELTDDDLISRVKRAIISELPSGSPSDDTIAKAVCLTPRTLQRRLAALGTTYSKLVDSVRRKLAEQYLAESRRSMKEITYLLGFSELSAFSRAFKRWTGKAPSTIRESASA